MAIPADQQEVAAYLETLAGAPPGETHISAIFLAPDTVYKLKKAVRLSFLDFTRISERERLLRRELELNQPAAPGLYRDVAAIVRTPAGFSLTATPDTPPIDWVLRMARVPAADFLDIMAQDGKLTEPLLDELADIVAAYHATCPIQDVDGLAALRHVARGNAEAADRAGLPRDLTASWLEAIQHRLTSLAPWLARRRETGFIRRGHGDLHLGNLCLWRGHPVPFDALEFDEAMATIDLGYDLAFLLMDLDQRVSRAAANRVLNRYVARTGDAGLTAGLAAFLSLRAMVRAHVRKAADQPGWAAYQQAAIDYLTPVPARLIAIGGLQGSGKSTHARRLAPRLGRAPGALILRSDEIRKRLHHAAPEQRLPPEAYSRAANKAVNEALLADATATIKGGHSVIADATFLGLGLRTRLAAAAHDAGVRFTGIWLEAPLAELERRVAARQGDASDATVAVLRQAAATSPGAGTWHAISADETAADRLNALLS